MSDASGRTAQPLLLLGATRRAALRNVLSKCVESWRERWSTLCDSVHVTLAEDAEYPIERIGSGGLAAVATSESQGALIYLRAAPEALAAMIGLTTFGADAGSTDTSRGIAGELQLETLRSLCDCIAQRARIDDVKVENKATSTPSGKSGRPRYVSASVTLGAARARINLSLSARLVELLAPPSSQPHTADGVLRRRQAITNESVRVEAVLGDVELSLNELARLSEGDVIVLDQPLATMGSLTMPDGKHIAKILLGSAGAQRAVSVTK